MAAIPNSRRSIIDILKFYHDSEALQTKLQIIHDYIVTEFPEGTWAQRKPNQI